MTELARPLSGIRVLDLTIFLAGPLATTYMAALGAEVVKIEMPGTGDPARQNPPYFGSAGVNFAAPVGDDLSFSLLKRNRGKKSVTLNLKHPEGSGILSRLVARSDVLVENFSPGTLDRLGFSYEQLHALNERLIVCSISGFGQTGPYRDLPAFDLVAQAMSGAMTLTGLPDDPPLRMGIAAGDLFASLMALAGTLAALRVRDTTGKGQLVDVSMLDALVAMVFDEAVDVYQRESMPLRTGNRRARLTPFSAYRTCDGWVVITCGSDRQWHALLKAMGRADLASGGFFNSMEERMARADEVDSFVEGWTSGRSRAEVVGELRQHHIPCAPVLTPLDVLTDGHVTSRGVLKPLRHPNAGYAANAVAPEMPIQLSDTPAGYTSPAPVLGQHTAEILGGLLGLSDREIMRLHEQGAI